MAKKVAYYSAPPGSDAERGGIAEEWDDATMTYRCWSPDGELLTEMPYDPGPATATTPA